MVTSASRPVINQIGRKPLILSTMKGWRMSMGKLRHSVETGAFG